MPRLFARLKEERHMEKGIGDPVTVRPIFATTLGCSWSGCEGQAYWQLRHNGDGLCWAHFLQYLLHLHRDTAEQPVMLGEERYWRECAICGCSHPPDFEGDCRDDTNRW